MANDNFCYIKSFKIDKNLYKDMNKRIAYLNSNLSDYVSSLIYDDLYNNSSNKIEDIYNLLSLNNKILLKLLWYIGGMYDTIDASKLDEYFKSNIDNIINNTEP